MRGNKPTNLLAVVGLICSLYLLLSGCGSDSGPSNDGQPAANSELSSHEQACKIVLKYADRYEETYLAYDGVEMEKRLSELELEYHKGMSTLAEEGKWTPSQEMGKSIKLAFLMGQFQGAVQSCKIEETHKDGTTIGCDEVKRLKAAMAKLCSE